MLEKMDAFFDARLSDYDAHMMADIEGAAEFYPFTAGRLPMNEGAVILDLGCGTGLELEYYFAKNPSAKVTGIDLAPGMLNALKEKFLDKELQLILGSYFDVPFGIAEFDGAVSVESLHHFTKAEKIPLYTKLCHALKAGGYFILTDYFAQDDGSEAFWRGELERLKAENGITDKAFYHFDTPLTVEHEQEALLAAGFQKVEVLRSWGATFVLKAYK